LLLTGNDGNEMGEKTEGVKAKDATRKNPGQPAFLNGK